MAAIESIQSKIQPSPVPTAPVASAVVRQENSKAPVVIESKVEVTEKKDTEEKVKQVV